ncbi:DUF1307 domain-containing protein [Streptococcus ovuberis]|uniref:YehR family protein n=1 Tax=Streptococcus ovuberis TaxID=1936207 RepID=A0A7X6MZH3_9STRE|nr:DUF1307 domain-containing protein [Streptococcus ovuberis]NKZ21297.1 YehR family protein [Streptococcus ovuberis]
MKLRKLLVGLVALLGAFALVACGAKTGTADFQLITEGQMDICNHLEYQGDKITLLETTTTILYSAMEVNSKEEAKEVMEAQNIGAWDGIEGVDHKVEYQDDRIVEVTSIDLAKADLDVLGELMPIESANGEKVEYLSFKMTKENFKKRGVKEVKDGQFKELE